MAPMPRVRGGSIAEAVAFFPATFAKGGLSDRELIDRDVASSSAPTRSTSN
jgi:hypothetical protein